MGAISFLFSIFSWLAGFFKPSSERALGKAEEVNKTQSEAIKDYKHELEVKSRPIGDDNSITDRL